MYGKCVIYCRGQSSQRKSRASKERDLDWFCDQTHTPTTVDLKYSWITSSFIYLFLEKTVEKKADKEDKAKGMVSNEHCTITLSN